MSDNESAEMRHVWTISSDELYEMLRRVDAGESPGIVYAEAYANAKRTRHEDIEDEGGPT